MAQCQLTFTSQSSIRTGNSSACSSCLQFSGTTGKPGIDVRSGCDVVAVFIGLSIIICIRTDLHVESTVVVCQFIHSYMETIGKITFFLHSFTGRRILPPALSYQFFLGSCYITIVFQVTLIGFRSPDTGIVTSYQGECHNRTIFPVFTILLIEKSFISLATGLNGEIIIIFPFSCSLFPCTGQCSLHGSIFFETKIGCFDHVTVCGGSVIHHLIGSRYLTLIVVANALSLIFIYRIHRPVVLIQKLLPYTEFMIFGSFVKTLMVKKISLSIIIDKS